MMITNPTHWDFFFVLLMIINFDLLILLQFISSEEQVGFLCFSYSWSFSYVGYWWSLSYKYVSALTLSYCVMLSILLLSKLLMKTKSVWAGVLSDPLAPHSFGAWIHYVGKNHPGAISFLIAEFFIFHGVFALTVVQANQVCLFFCVHNSLLILCTSFYSYVFICDLDISQYYHKWEGKCNAL